MKQFLLALVLIALPVGAFSAYHLHFAAPVTTTDAPASAALGDLSSFEAIVADAQSIAATGDLAATGKRLTDFESAWDAAQPTLRAIDGAAWGNVDDAHDVALKALRDPKPVPARVDEGLSALATALADPTLGGAAPTGAPEGEAMVAGMPVTDANGRALPCEEMLKTYRAEMASATLSDADRSAVEDYLGKGTERCNADDDRRADEFLAQGLALLRR